MTEFVCEHVPLNAQTAVMVLRTPGPPGSVLVECPCCHVQGYDDASQAAAEPMDCPYCGVASVPFVEAS